MIDAEDRKWMEEASADLEEFNRILMSREVEYSIVECETEKLRADMYELSLLVEQTIFPTPEDRAQTEGRLAASWERMRGLQEKMNHKKVLMEEWREKVDGLRERLARIRAVLRVCDEAAAAGGRLQTE